jgi:two-component system NtrC family sensor kinase
VVQDLRRVGRADDVSTTPVDVAAALDTAATMVNHELRDRARLVKRYAPGVPFVEVNEARLGQVFLKLLQNAAHAIPAGHPETNEVVLSTSRCEDGRVCVEVRDTGVGIDPVARARVFDPYFTTKDVGQGTGLGLSICHSIVTGYGGTIEVASELGEGTTFRVLLPPGPRQVPAKGPPRR